MVSTSDFPQADRLEQVGLVAAAIAAGKRSDTEIEAFIGLASNSRQGRYYRRAAEVLGLITTQDNYSSLTDLGVEYNTVNSNGSRIDFLARCLVETPVFREALRYIHQYKPDDAKLRQWFRGYYPGAQNTADRRFITFTNYLRDADLLGRNLPRNDLLRYRGSVIKKTTDQGIGLRGENNQEPPRQAPVFTAAGIQQADIDIQKIERAGQAHWRLVDAKATFLEQRELEPVSNPQIDLFTNDAGAVIIYEMKSVNPADRNLLSQVRKAVAQLYEYRYVYNEPQARLCIVTNAAIPTGERWLLNYLAIDRQIAYEYTADFVNFECDQASKNLLGSFSP
jgi:hypothetical protein